MKLKIISFITIWSVIFNNFHLGASILLTDIIYGILIILILPSLKIRFNLLNSFFFLLLSVYLLLITVNFVIYQEIHSLLSQCRFIFGLIALFVLYLYFNNRDLYYLKKYYINFVIIASLFIIIQNFTFHVLGFHFQLSFGKFNLMEISFDGAIPGIHSYIRSGGLFREPSWYVVFLIPGLYLTFKERNFISFFILCLGIIFSTSSLGYLYIFLFILIVVLLSNNNKLKLGFLIVSLFIFSGFYLIYLYYEVLFERLIFTLQTGGSLEVRVIEPFKLFFNKFSLLGANTSFIGNGNELFVNSFLYIFFSFGILGIFLFLPLIISFRQKYLFISICLLLTIIIEGLIGRMDFWIVLLVFLLMRNTNFERIRI